jgi:hypothetical protein
MDVRRASASAGSCSQRCQAAGGAGRRPDVREGKAPAVAACGGPFKRVTRRPLALRRRPACLAPGGGPPGRRLASCRAAGRRLACCLATSRRLARCRAACRRLAGCCLAACCGLAGSCLATSCRLPCGLPCCRLPCRLPCCRLASGRLAGRRLAGRRLATGCGPLTRRGAGLPCRSLTRSRHGSPPFASEGWQDVSPAKG